MASRRISARRSDGVVVNDKDLTSPTATHINFVSTPMRGKPVDSLPGIGPKAATNMERKNFKKVIPAPLPISTPKLIYMSRTKCGIGAVVVTRSTSVLLLPRCTWAPTERHSSPVEVVLTGSEAALLGLIEIPRSPCGRRRY